jgi:hypothetical protein
MIKTLDMINDNVAKEIIKYAVKGKVKLIGSNSIRGLLFTNDLDIETDLKGSAKNISNLFQKNFKFKYSYFVDFKCGLDERLVYDGDYSKASINKYLKNPLIKSSTREDILKSKGEKQVELIRSLYILRWKPKDIQNGYVVLYDGTKKTLEDALLDDTIIKLDFIVPVGDTFAEVSENYYFKQTRPSDKTLKKELEDDIEYYSHIDCMKALKRLYSLLRLTNPESSKIKLLEDFFNSWVGYLTKIKNDMLIIKQLMELKYINWDKAYNSVQTIKQRLSNVKNIKMNDITDYKQFNSILDYITKIIDNNAKLFLKDIYI